MRGKKRILKSILSWLLILSILITSVSPASAATAGSKAALTATRAELVVGQQVTVTLEGGTIRSVKSKDKKIASVNGEGVITGKKAGKTTVTYTDTAGKKYKCRVTVKVGLSKSKIYLTKGKNAVIKLGGTSAKKITVANKNVITAKKGSGKTKNDITITAKEKGDTVVKVKGKNKKTYKTKVVVETPVISEQKVLMTMSDAKKLSVKNTKQTITWSSSAETIVKVDEKGVLTPVGEGSATITATDESGATYQCAVTIENPRFESGEISLLVGDTRKVQLKSNTQTVKWKTSNSNIISIDEKGVVTALAEGEAEVIATLPDGSRYVLKVKVAAKAVDPEDPVSKTNVKILINNGMGEEEEIYVKPDTKISDVPEPEYDDSHAFIGWYLDEDLAQKAMDEAVVTEGLQLYAKTAEIGGQTADDLTKVASVKDVDPTFTIKVKASDKSLTAAQLKEKIDFRDYTLNDEETAGNCIEVTGGNGEFVISGKHYVLDELASGFATGGSYVIILPEDTDPEGKFVYTFDGKPEATREFDINIKPVQQNNLGVNDNVVMLSVGELSALKDGTGKDVPYLDGEIMTVDGEGNATNEGEITGSFELTGKKAKDLHLGSVVAIYQGMDPEEAIKNFQEYEKDENNHVVYVEITDIKGDVFSFKSAKAESVIKTPEVLPVNAGTIVYYDEAGDVTETKTEKYKYGIDLDLDDSDETYEIPVSALDWSDDMYAATKLNADTTLDEGDFIAFYTGDFSDQTSAQFLNYEQVTEVVKTGVCDDPSGTGDKIEYVVIRTKAATKGDIADAGRSFSYESVDLNAELTEEEKNNLINDIEDQVADSHYIEQTAIYMARATIATDKFKDITGLENLTDYNILLTNEDGEQFDETELMGLSSGSLYEEYEDIINDYDRRSDSTPHEPWKVDVTIAKKEYNVGKAKHLKSGLGIMVGQYFTITVHMPDKEDVKVEVHMDITQEVNFDVGFGGEVVWGMAAFIPYPKDVLLKPYFEVGSYTGFDITTKFSSNGPNGEVFCDIGDEIKRLCENFEVESPDKAETVSEFVTGKYQRLLQQNTTYVNLINRKITDFRYPVIPGILKLVITIYLRAYGDMDIFGFHFHYKVGKKTTVIIHLFSFKMDTVTVDTFPSELDFQVYLMGTLALRAGIAVELTLNLTITLPFPKCLGSFAKDSDGKQKTKDFDLGKAGIGVEVGAYIDMSGIFYYHKRVVGGKAKELFKGTKFSEIGVYVMLYLVADIMSSTSLGVDWWAVKLFEKKFPIKKIGDPDYPINFTLKQSEIKDVSMRQYVKKFAVPDAYYQIDRLKLNTGQILPYIYEGAEDAAAYGVELSNSDWEYIPEKHIVQLKSSFEGMESECDMTLYFKKDYLPLSNTLMTRHIHIKWDNYLDGYAITPYSQGGTYVEAIVGKQGVKVNKPVDPVRQGYQFTGWYKDEACTIPYTFPETMPAESVEIYAGWTPANDTPYLIEHYIYNASTNGYDYVETDERKGTTDTLIKLSENDKKDYDGYECISLTDTGVKIGPMGSSVVRVYYDYKTGNAKFTDPSAVNADIESTANLGAPIFTPSFYRSGYDLAGWKNTVTGEIISMDDLSAERKVGEDVYPAGVITCAKEDDQSFEAVWVPRNDINYRVEYYVQQPSGAYTVQATTYAHATPDYEVTLEECLNSIITASFKDGQENEKKRTGKADTILSVTEGDREEVAFESMTVGGQTCEGNKAVIANDGSTVVKIRYGRTLHKVTLKSSGEGDESGIYTDYDVFYDGKMALPVPEKEGYRFLGYADSEGKDVPINEEGITVVQVKGDMTFTSKGFTPNTYVVAYNANGGNLSAAETQEFTYGVEQNLPTAPVRAGYTFLGWSDSEGRLYQPGEAVKNLTKQNGVTVNLVAKWEITGYTISYDLDNGTIAENANPVKYRADDTERLLDYPEKEGYTFGGWFDGDTEVKSIPGSFTKNLNLKAKWIPRNDTVYLVKHYQMDATGEGRTLADQETFTGTTGLLVAPETKNYEGFQAPSKKEATLKGNGSTVVEYVYTRKNHTLTLQLNGGTLSQEAPDAFAYGAELALPVPTKEGSTFIGWKEGEKTFTTATMPDRDLTLEAQWVSGEKATVTVRHMLMDTNGKYVTADSEILYGESGAEVEVTPKDYGEGISAPEKKTVTLGNTEDVELSYERESHKLKFVVEADDVRESDVYYGASIMAPVINTKGRTFKWDTPVAEKMGQSDLTYTAVWTPETYAVAYDLAGGTLENAEDKNVTYGEAYGELPVPVKANTEFIGWYDQREGGRKIDERTTVSATADHILYARWNDVSADIIYRNIRSTDTNNNPKTYKYGESTRIVEPERAGYDFLGWQVGDSKELVNTYVIPAESKDAVTLTANWKAREYTLSLYSYSGLYLVKNFKCEEDITKISLPKNSGYKLTGWKDMESGEILTKLPETMPAKNLTLVSQWTVAEYRIIFNNMGLATIDPVTYKLEDNSFVLQAPTTNRLGYDFVGWYSDASFSESCRIDVFTPVAYDFNVYAKWSPRKYTVVFNGNGGQTDESDSYSAEFVFDQDGKLPANRFTNDGYIFDGWAINSAAAKERKVTYTDQCEIGASAGVNLYRNADDVIVNVFAVWKPLDYTIAYKNVVLVDGDSKTATGQPNKTTYNIESADEDYVLAPPTEIGEGYEFLGWYDGTGADAKKIENLKVRGEKGAKTLYARWAHAGIYSLSMVESTSESPTGGTENDKTTFKITRKIPNADKGVTVSTDPQKVYFRSVNGTLIGGTASPINFYHVGGQNVFAVFSDTECYVMDNNAKSQPQEVNSTDEVSVTFDVKNENVATRYYGDETPRETNGVFAQLYSIADRNENKKYYTVELYRITSSLGNVTGAYGKTKEVRRDMTVPTDKRLTYDKLYGTKEYIIHREDWFDDDSEFRYLYHLGNLMTGSGDSLRFGYTDLTRDMVYYLKSAGGERCNLAAQYLVGRTKGKGYAKMYIQYYLNGQWLFRNNTNSSSPSSSTSWRGWTNTNITWDLLAKNNGHITYRGDIDEDNITYVKYTWYQWKFHLKAIDNKAPEQIGIAPAATTDYKKGDKVRFTVIYNELINSVKDANVDTTLFADYMPLDPASISCVAGEGTNMLVFEGTASKDFSNTTWSGSGTNEELMKIKPVTGTSIVTDLKNNSNH